jgi:hypothetical protein
MAHFTPGELQELLHAGRAPGATPYGKAEGAFFNAQEQPPRATGVKALPAPEERKKKRELT